MSQLDGKVAIVTGGSTGIGLATARAFAHEGAAVAIADVDETRGAAAAAEIVAGGGRSIFVRTDVSIDADCAALVGRTVAELGRLDCAFNNAGIEGAQAALHEYPPADWDRVLAVNLTGVWSCLRHEIPAMLAGGGGAIVNCSSVAGLVGFRGLSAYTAAKHGVVGLTKSAALEYATAGIRVNAVCPGAIATEMMDRFTHGDDALTAQMVASEPVGRFGAPEEIADAVVYLCSPAASFVTGQALAVDGGMIAG